MAQPATGPAPEGPCSTRADTPAASHLAPAPHLAPAASRPAADPAAPARQHAAATGSASTGSVEDRPGTAYGAVADGPDAAGPADRDPAAAAECHPVDEKPPFGRLLPAALQHIAALYAGVVTPPLIIGQAVGLDAAGTTRLIGASLVVAGVVSLTRVRSRYVVAAAGGALLVLGVFPVLGAVVSLVPMPVLGGAGIVLSGSIAVSGIRTFSEAGLDDSSHIILVAVALGAGIIPLAAPTFYAGFPAWAQTVLGSGISAGALVAVLLILFFHHLGTRSLHTVPALKSS